MSTTEEKFDWTVIDSKRHDRSMDIGVARNSLGENARLRLTIQAPNGEIYQQDVDAKRTQKKLTVDYNPSDGKCKLTEDSLYEGEAILLMPFNEGDINQVFNINPSGMEAGRLTFKYPLTVKKNKRFVLNLANRLEYIFNQDSKIINVHDQSTSGVYVPILISVVNAKVANQFYVKNDLTKPVVVKHADMDSVLAADYSTVNGGPTISGNNQGDIIISGKFNNDVSAFTAYLDVDKVLLFRIADNDKTRNFRTGTEITFYLSTVNVAGDL